MNLFDFVEFFMFKVGDFDVFWGYVVGDEEFVVGDCGVWVVICYFCLLKDCGVIFGKFVDNFIFFLDVVMVWVYLVWLVVCGECVDWIV